MPKRVRWTGDIYRDITVADRGAAIHRALLKAMTKIRITHGQARHIVERTTGRCPHCGAWRECQ